MLGSTGVDAETGDEYGSGSKAMESNIESPWTVRAATLTTASIVSLVVYLICMRNNYHPWHD